MGCPVSLLAESYFRMATFQGSTSNRINYEICVLLTLRERLRCKEVREVGVGRFRNPDSDLPADFVERCAECYDRLGLPERLSRVWYQQASTRGPRKHLSDQLLVEPIGVGSLRRSTFGCSPDLPLSSRTTLFRPEAFAR